MSSSLQRKLSILPDLPGVYIFKNRSGEAIYIGKASSLRKRVKSYFHERPRWIKERFMLEEVWDIDYVVVSNEVEALILEGNLIKKHKPKYNIVLKDDKNYPILRVGINEDFPSIKVVRRPLPDGALYFGPFVSSRALKELMDELRKGFGVRSCSDRSFTQRSRPCILYQIGRCLAPCVEKVSKEEYRSRVEEMVSVLQGRGEGILRVLREEMEREAKKLNFERAARIRDRIVSIERVLSFQVVYRPFGESMDAISFQRKDGTYFVCVLSMDSGRVVEKRNFSIDYPGDPPLFLREFILRFYERFPLPDEVLVAEEPLGVEEVELSLRERRGRSVRVFVPKRGDRLRFLKLAEENLLELIKAEAFTEKGELIVSLKRFLGLRKLPEVVEAIDISHVGGSFVVGSVVRAVSCELDRSGYRAYHLSHGVDDLGNLSELLERRFKKHPVPDLLLIDGGRAHLKKALEVLEGMGVDIPDVVSIAKGRGQGVPDRVYFEGGRRVEKLLPSRPEVRFLIKMRDEAHRFSNLMRKKWKRREDLSSILLKIKGIGPKRAKMILERWGSPWEFFERVRMGEDVNLPRNVLEEVRRFLEQKE